jgi:hypothetical protein
MAANKHNAVVALFIPVLAAGICVRNLSCSRASADGDVLSCARQLASASTASPTLGEHHNKGSFRE